MVLSWCSTCRHRRRFAKVFARLTHGEVGCARPVEGAVTGLAHGARAGQEVCLAAIHLGWILRALTGCTSAIGASVTGSARLIELVAGEICAAVSS